MESSSAREILARALDPRLRLHNAVLGLAYPVPPWPAPFAQAGFEIVRIEQRVTVAEGGSVVVDLLFADRARNALLGVECKDGTVQVEQAQRYQAMAPLDLVRTASVSLPDPSAATLDVAYAVPGQWAEQTLRELHVHAPRAGVLVIDTQISWQGTPPSDPRLRETFTEPLPADLRAIPRLMLADEHSPASALAAAVANELHAAMEQGRESVTAGALVEQACWGWPRYGRAFQGKLAKKVEELLRDGEKNELNDFLAVERRTRETSTPVVRLQVRTTAPATQAGQVRGSRAVRTRLDAFVSRVTGRPAPPSPGQLDLLSQLDAFDVDDDDDEE